MRAMERNLSNARNTYKTRLVQKGLDFSLKNACCIDA
jgi:hypothetical protein